MDLGPIAAQSLFWGGAVLSGCLCGNNSDNKMLLLLLWFDKGLLLQHHDLRVSARPPVMMCRQKLVSLWVFLLLVAALCPGAYSKRGGIFKGRGKGDGDKAPPSPSRGLSKHGLKWAGAAAAGMLGGTGTGYGLGLFGRPKHGSGKHHGHKTEQDQQHYHDEGQRSRNQSLWRAFVKAAAPAPPTNVFLTLGHVVSFLIAAWIRDV